MHKKRRLKTRLPWLLNFMSLGKMFSHLFLLPSLFSHLRQEPTTAISLKNKYLKIHEILQTGIIFA
jgi:hypothetical protein